MKDEARPEVGMPEAVALAQFELRFTERGGWPGSLGALREDYEERAAIHEFDGGLPRTEAERRARALFPWPAVIDGSQLTLDAFTSCARCPDDATPARRGTWVRYGETPLCLACALDAEQATVRPQ